jgi:hypothetical protein
VAFKRTIAITVLGASLSGCAADKDWMIRELGVESTIGTDMNKQPAGKVIPPAGLGGDLTLQTPEAQGFGKA